MNKIIVFVFIILFSCKSTKNIESKVFYNETNNTTLIKGVKEVDSINLLGKWENIDNPIGSNEIFFKNNENLVSIYLAKKINYAKYKNAADADFFKNEIAHTLYVLNYFNLKYAIIETDDLSYYALNYMDRSKSNEIVQLIGLKNGVVIHLEIINPNKNIDEKLKYLKSIFNYIKI
jgi:hypothetical protein